MVLRQAFVLAIVRLAIGVPTALGVSKFVESFLFGVKPNPPPFLSAVAVLLSATLLAGYVPARRASRIDPGTAVTARVRAVLKNSIKIHSLGVDVFLRTPAYAICL